MFGIGHVLVPWFGNSNSSAIVGAAAGHCLQDTAPYFAAKVRTNSRGISPLNRDGKYLQDSTVDGERARTAMNFTKRCFIAGLN